MITIIGRRLIIPDCDRILGVAGDKNTPIKVKVSADTLNRYFDGKNYGDIAVILKLKHENATVDLSPILCGHDTDGVYVGDVSLISTVEKGLVTCQALLIAPGSAAEDSDLNDAEALWQSDEDYFYISDDIELKNYSSDSDEYNAFENLLGTIAGKLDKINAAKNTVIEKHDTVIEKHDEVLLARNDAAQAATNSEASASNAKKSAEDAETAKVIATNLLTPYKEHLKDESNPHKVTASQVGTYTKEKIDYLLSGKSDSGHTHENYDKHLNNVSNPHEVTAEQVGAYTKEEVDLKVDGVDSRLNNHEINHTNPHEVTAEQIDTYTKSETNNKFKEYVKISDVFEKTDFKWTDFEHIADGDNGIIGTVDDNSIIIDNAANDREFVQIVCRGNTLGFTLSVSGYGRLRINGDNLEFEDKTVTIPMTLLTSDLYFYGKDSSWTFSNMKKGKINGISELESQIGDIDTALSNIIDIMEELAPLAYLPSDPPVPIE